MPQGPILFFFRLSVTLFMVGGIPAISQKSAITDSPYDAIYSGTPWFDDQGNPVNAHGACIVKDNGSYYLFGECHSDTSNAFIAFNCYSSADLMNWKFEKQVLRMQPNGLLGPNRIGERVKVMKCPLTGEYVMYMHTDDMGYRDPKIGYATCSTINGDYTFHGALPYNNGTINKWDMGAFQDTDGAGYILIHEGSIYKLSDDYRNVTSQVVKDIIPGAESPAMFKIAGIYFWLGSNKTSWERNDNFYYTATSINGPWTSRGKFAPDGTLTWNSQTTFVLPVTGSEDSTYIFMGDRWSYPRQGSAATYVWQPLTVSGTSMSIPVFNEAWRINPATGTWSNLSTSGTTIDNIAFDKKKKQFRFAGDWIHRTNDTFRNTESVSDADGAAMRLKFTGTQLKLYGVNTPLGGYGRLEILDKNDNIVLSATIDFYSKYHDVGLKFVSPFLKKGIYTLNLVVVGAHSVWYNKARNVFGSTKNYVSVDRIILK